MNTTTTTCSRCGCEIVYASPEQKPAEADGIDWASALSHLKPTVCCDCARAESERSAAQLQRDHERERLRELDLRNVPRRYRDASFDNFKTATPLQAKALAVMRSRSGDGVLMVGPAGCGKTHLAAAAISCGPAGGMFVGATELLDDMRRGFEGGGRGLFERALTAPLLALDDLGQESATDWVRDRLYTLANSRWNDLLPVIVTSNFGPDELGGRIGTGTASRIVGLCRYRLRVSGADGRKAASGAATALPTRAESREEAS